jgi:hypothetical protein
MVRICFAPRTLVLISLGGVAPAAAGFATGSAALALGMAFAVACPLLLGIGAIWPRTIRLFPLYFAALFVLAIAVLPFNSAAFIADSWAALFLTLVTLGSGVMPARRRPTRSSGVGGELMFTAARGAADRQDRVGTRLESL